MVDNTGILAMLGRQVPNIVVFSNHQAPPKIVNGELVLDDSVSRHFKGFHPEKHVQVFSKDVYDKMCKSFMKSMKKGEPLVWVGNNIPVEENIPCGVEKHNVNQIIWVYLNKSQQFIDLLHPSVQDAVEGEPSKVSAGVAWLPKPLQNHLPLVNDVISDHFNDFPHYDTISKLTLTNAEANLLTTYTNWATKNFVISSIKEMLSK